MPGAAAQAARETELEARLARPEGEMQQLHFNPMGGYQRVGYDNLLAAAKYSF